MCIHGSKSSSGHPIPYLLLWSPGYPLCDPPSRSVGILFCVGNNSLQRRHISIFIETCEVEGSAIWGA